MKKKRIKKKSTFKTIKTRLVRTFVIVGVISSTVIIAVGVWQLRNVFQPISTHASSFTEEFNTEENTVIFAYINESSEITQVHVVGLNSTEKTVRELVIPSNTMTLLPLGLDEYQLKNIFKVIAINTNNEPSEEQIRVLQQTLQNITATVSDNIILIKEVKPPESVVDSITSPESLFNLTLNPDWTSTHLTSSLTRATLLQYVWHLVQTKPYNYRLHNLEKSYSTQQVALKDGTQVIKLDPLKSDALNKQLFEKINLVEERIPIRIINTTQTNGLAGHIQRLFTNAGGNVIETETEGKTLEKTKFIIHQAGLQDSYTVKILQNILHLKPEIVEEPGTYHYAITILLGEDYAEFMKGEHSESQE